MTYPLRALLGVREAEEKARESELARELESVEAAKRKLEAASREAEARDAKLGVAAREHEETLASGRLIAADVHARGLYLDSLRDGAARARQAALAEQKAVAAAEAAAEQAREALGAAVRARKALESHREAFLAEEQKARERAAEEAIDELAARRRK